MKLKRLFGKKKQKSDETSAEEQNEEQKTEMEDLLSDSAKAKQQRLEKLKNDHGIIIG